MFRGWATRASSELRPPQKTWLCSYNKAFLEQQYLKKQMALQFAAAWSKGHGLKEPALRSGDRQNVPEPPRIALSSIAAASPVR
jgi:hypothetical protein